MTKQSPQRSSGQAPQSHQKSLRTGLAIFRNEIATPFGLGLAELPGRAGSQAMTVFLGMRTYDTRH